LAEVPDPKPLVFNDRFAFGCPIDVDGPIFKASATYEGALIVILVGKRRKVGRRGG